MSNHYYKHDKIENFLIDVLLKTGLNREHSYLIANNLVESNLCGYDSHGVLRFEHYITRFENKTTNVSPGIKIKEVSSSSSIVDGDSGPGQVVAYASMKEAVRLAELSAVGCAIATNSNHFGRASYYTAIAVDKNMIGISMTHTDSNTLPYGGSIPYFGSNTLAFSVPTNREFNIVVDFSMTSMSFGKIYSAQLRGAGIPDGVAVDESGNITSDPFKVSSLLPAAGYKGYALAMMIEILCTMLTGNPFCRYVVDMYKDIDKSRCLGHFFMAIDIKKFRAVESFKSDIGVMVKDLLEIPPAHGFDSVGIPGKIEYETRQSRLEHGILLPETLKDSLVGIGNKYSVDFPEDALVNYRGE